MLDNVIRITFPANEAIDLSPRVPFSLPWPPRIQASQTNHRNLLKFFFCSTPLRSRVDDLIVARLILMNMHPCPLSLPEKMLLACVHRRRYLALVRYRFPFLSTDRCQVSRYFARAVLANPLGPCRASQGRRGSSLKPRYVTRSICGRVTGPPRVIRLRDPSRAGALQSESATIGVRGSVYANGNRLISDAFRRNLIRRAMVFSFFRLFIFFFFSFRICPQVTYRRPRR